MQSSVEVEKKRKIRMSSVRVEPTSIIQSCVQ